MLALDAIEKTYDAFRLGPVDLRVGNEVVAVLGPSGCGKSTLLRIVAGLTPPDAGTVSLDGTPLDGRPPQERGVGLVFQNGALFPHLTARENIAYAAGSATAVERLAREFEVASILDRPASALSGGERQRVAIARSLAADPDALLLDEPLSDLDAPIRRRLRDELREHLTGLDVPVVYVTHNQNQASVIGDRIAVVANGAIQQVAPPDEVFRRPSTPFVASFTGSENLFPVAVTSTDDGPALDWGPHRLVVPDLPAGVSPGGDAWGCIRPEYVDLVGADASPEGANLLPGTVEASRFAGHAYRISVVPRGVETRLRVIASPLRVEGLGLEAGATVRVKLTPRALHVIPAGGETPGDRDDSSPDRSDGVR